MHQVRTLPEQAFTFPQRFANQSNFFVLQVAQPAMNNPGRAAGGSGSKIVLFQQQGTFPRQCASPRNGDSVNAATDHDRMVALVTERAPYWHGEVHLRIGCGWRKPKPAA